MDVDRRKVPTEQFFELVDWAQTLTDQLKCLRDGFSLHEITDEDWDLRSEFKKKWWKERGKGSGSKHTKVHDGACVFANRTFLSLLGLRETELPLLRIEELAASGASVFNGCDYLNLYGLAAAGAPAFSESAIFVVRSPAFSAAARNTKPRSPRMFRRRLFTIRVSPS